MTQPIPRFLTNAVKALALSAALGVSALAPAIAQNYPDLIRIGATAPGGVKFTVARHNGWFDEAFAEYGIDVELVAFTGGGAEAQAALATNSIQFAYIGNNPALRLAAAGGDAKLIGLNSWIRSGGVGIIVREDSDIESLADLDGRQVAFLHGTVRHSVLAKALDSVGLTTDDIEPLNLNFDASGPALLRGDIDALVETDNTVQRLVETGEARRIFDGNDHPEWSVPNTLLVNGTFAEQYPELVETLLEIDLRLAQWVDENHEETIRIFVDGTGSAEEAARRNFRDGFWQDPTLTDEAVAALRGEEAFMASAGLLTGSVDYDTWIDTSYLDAVKARLEAEQ